MSGVLLEKHQVSAEGPPRMGCVPSARLRLHSHIHRPSSTLFSVQEADLTGSPVLWLLADSSEEGGTQAGS